MRSKLLLFSILVAGLSSTAQGTAPTNKSRCVVSLVQYPIEGNKSVDQIIAKMDGFLKEASESNADLVVFPELMTFDAWRVAEVESNLIPSDQEREETIRIAREVTPKFLAAVPALVEKYNVAILAGTTPRIEDDRLFNTCELFFQDGTKVRQNKLYPTRWERLAGISSGDELHVFKTPWGRASILTCFDIEFPDVSVALAKQTPPSLILVPSMTESISGLQRVRWCGQARAVELHAYVLVSGTIGDPSPDWHHFGQAAFFGPRESAFDPEPQLGQLNEPTVLTVSLDMLKLENSRKQTAFYPAAEIADGDQSREIKIRLEEGR